MKTVSILLILSFVTSSLAAGQQGPFYNKDWVKQRDLACLNNPKYKANAKFNRLYTLVKSLQLGPPRSINGCQEESIEQLQLESKNIPDHLKSKLDFAKELFIQSRVNAALQMSYFYYRIFDEKRSYDPENIPLERIAENAMSSVYGGYDQEVRERVKKAADNFVKLLKDKKVKRDSPAFHAKVFNKKIEKWNRTLNQTRKNKYELYRDVYHPFKMQYHQDLAEDIGLLMLVDKVKDRFGGDVLPDNGICTKNSFTPKMGLGIPKDKNAKCFYGTKKAQVRPKDIESGLKELEIRFWHEKRNADKPISIARKLSFYPKEKVPQLEQELNEYLADMLVYSPRTYGQVLSERPEYADFVCLSFDYAFEREGDEYISTKISNGIEFFGPASMWIMSLGIAPFTRKSGFLTSHKMAIKAIMGVTALDIIWRGKNILDLGEDLETYETQILAGNTDSYSFKEYERLKQQYYNDKKGLVLVASYEVLSLMAITRLAKIVSGKQITKYLTNNAELKSLFLTASHNKKLQKTFSKNGITDEKSFVEFMKKAPKKEREKFSSAIMDSSFGMGTALTAGIAGKELGDTLYFMYGFPYIPQGISALE